MTSGACGVVGWASPITVPATGPTSPAGGAAAARRRTVTGLSRQEANGKAMPLDCSNAAHGECLQRVAAGLEKVPVDVGKVWYP